MRPLLSGAVLRSQTDERLVALAREGHDQAFVAIAQRYRRELMAHARRLVPADRAEDIVQQAMLSAWSALRRRADVLDVRAWLHRIVHNAALRTVQRSEDHDELSDALTTDARAEGEAERRLDARHALVALAALPEPQRRALELTALAGSSGREAAGALGMSEGALRQLVHRARATLRAGAGALTPTPLLTWAAGAPSAPAVARITEISAGVGMVGTLTKVCATVAVTATIIGGASQVLPGGHVQRGQTRRAAAGRVAGPVALAAPGAGGPLALPGAAALPFGRPVSGRVHTGGRPTAGLRKHGQQQRQSGGSGPNANVQLQSHQTGVDQGATGSANAGPGVSGAAGPRVTQSAAGSQGATSARRGDQGASGTQRADTEQADSQGSSDANGANQP